MLWKFFLYPTWFSPFRYLPKPKNTPLFIGHVRIAFAAPGSDFFMKFITEIPNDGIICIPGMLHTERLFLTDPKTLAEVLVHNCYDYEKPPRAREFLYSILGNGLPTMEGNVHRFSRKQISPSFSFRHIKELYPIFWSKSIEVRNAIVAEISDSLHPENEKSLPPRGVVDISQWTSKFGLDNIGVAGLGRNFNTLKNSDDKLSKTYETLLEPSNEKSLTTTLRNIFHQLVQEKKERVKLQHGENIDILLLLIQSNNFTDEMLVDQLLTFLGVGHETAAAACSWCAYLLAKYPDVQMRLRKEIRSRLPSPSESSRLSDDAANELENLPYLNAVGNEALRLWPTVPVTQRISIRPTTILSQKVPKGTAIYICPWAINRSPDLWGTTANDFIPDRWIDTDTGRANNTGGATSNYSNLTFLHGPRSCIGEKFAKGEMKAFFALFCGSFQFSMADPNEVVIPIGAVSIKPKNGMKLRLERLEGW